jgi:hypothetical protein
MSGDNNPRWLRASRIAYGHSFRLWVEIVAQSKGRSGHEAWTCQSVRALFLKIAFAWVGPPVDLKLGAAPPASHFQLPCRQTEAIADAVGLAPALNLNMRRATAAPRFCSCAAILQRMPTAIGNRSATKHERDTGDR